MKIITVFNKPTDYPSDFVARVFHINFNQNSNSYDSVPEAEPIVVSKDYSDIRQSIEQRDPCLIRMGRHEYDAPCVVETWI